MGGATASIAPNPAPQIGGGPAATASALKLFTSYAHEDEAYRSALEKYLRVLKLQGMVEHWDDRKIVPGDKWAGEIDANLNAAQLIVLLVSIDFINSDYIWEKEMRRALERHGAGEAVVVPVLVRTTEGWSDLAGLGSLQALPVKPGSQPEEVVPIKKWGDDDEAWGNVVAGLRRTIRKFRETLAARPAPVVPAAPEASAPAAAEASAKGVKALSGWMENPDVREVVEKFRTGFHAASRHLILLGDLKDLHDHLHTLQFQCYNFVLHESRRAAEADVNWESLAQPEITLSEIVAKIQEVAVRPSLAGVELAWVKDLATAAAGLRTALEASALKGLKAAVYGIGRVLAYEPLRINIQLSDTAASLPLGEFEAGMTQAAQKLAAGDLASPEGQRIQRGVEALSKLRAGVTRLTKEHRLWQDIDAEMRRIERTLGQDAADLELAWPGLKPRLAALYTGSTEPWALLLQEEIGKLESALASAVPAKIAQIFRRTYGQAGVRFYKVDLELKELCDELRKVGTELDDLLTKLQ